MNRVLVIIAGLLLTAEVHAGVTIHYEGYAASADAVNRIIAAAKMFADKHRWKTSDASAPHGKLERVIESKKTSVCLPRHPAVDYLVLVR
jgi:hypothetical protein